MPFQTDFFSLLVNICAPLVLLVGGLRLVWLFLSPTPKAVEGVILRRRWLSPRAVGPAASLAGILLFVVFVAAAVHLRTLPHSWWNLVPFIAIWISGLLGAGLLIVGVVTQGVLVGSYRGLPQQDWGRSAPDNFKALLLAGMSVALAAAADFRWLHDLDIATASSDQIQQHILIIRILFYSALGAAAIGHWQSGRARQSAKRARRAEWMAHFGWPMLLIVLGSVLTAVRPADFEVARFIAERDEDWFKASLHYLSVPSALWRMSLLALPCLGLMIVLSIESVCRWTAAIKSSGWRALLSCAGFLALTIILALHYVGLYEQPDGTRFDVWLQFALPLTVGMLSAPMLGPGWRLIVRISRTINRAAGENLFLQIVLWTPVVGLALGLLYGASLLTAFSIALAVVGWAAAVANGLSNLPLSISGAAPETVQQETAP